MKFMNDKGNVAVITALCMPLMIGGAGLGVETGYWYYEQLHLQQAADAAAYAAALEHYQGNTTEMLSSATAAAEANSYDADTDTIVMANPSASFAGNQRTVDITLTRTIPRAFTAIFNDAPIQMAVKATAKYEPNSDACLLALDKAAANAIWIHGNASMNISGCVVSANSLSDTAITAAGSSNSSVPCMSTAGDVSLNSNVHFTACTEAATGQLPVADPYAGITIPSPSASCTAWSGKAHTAGTYSAGCNTNGIKINNTGHTLAAGTYIFDGVNVQINGGGGLSSLTGGVTLVFVNGATVTMNGNADIQLAAPTTGPYAGMLYMGDRTGTPTKSTFNGTATSRMYGTAYFPNDNVEFAGNFSGFNGCTQIVAKTIEWTGNSNLSVDCSAYGMGKIQVGTRPYLVG